LSSKRTFLVLVDNDENIDVNDFFYEVVTGAISIESLYRKAADRFGSNPFQERLIDKDELLDFESMTAIREQTGLIPVVHYYPIEDGMVDDTIRHYYSKRDLETRRRAFGV
jgi:hypothetical protein